MMSVITTNIFLILLALCLINTKLLVRAGYKLLALFVCFAALRFVFPVELPFTVTLPLPLSLSKIITRGHLALFTFHGQPVSFWTLFLMVWGVGTVLGLLLYGISVCRANYLITLYGKELTGQTPCQDILNRVCEARNKPNPFRIIEMPGLDSPVLFGILCPRILLPVNFKASEKDLYYILRHEASHHFHHDLLLKGIVKVITLVYWWDPFCILLNRQTDIILEMRADDTLTLTDIESTHDYMQCLMHAATGAANQTFLPKGLTIALLPREKSDIMKRFALLSSNQEQRSPLLNISLCLASSSICLLSYAFILEACCEMETFEDIRPAQSLEQSNIISPLSGNSYLIDNGDGTFDLYCDDRYLETIDSLEYYPADIPIYNETNGLN